MNTSKIIGIVLLAVGVLLIGWGAWQSYDIFTGKSPAPEIFKVPTVGESQVISGGTLQEQIMQKVISEQIGNLMPPEYISQMFNLVSWSMFMMILFLAGSKIAVIGVRSIKD